MKSESIKDNLVYMPIEELKNNILNQYKLSIYEIESIKFKDTEKQRAVFKISTDKGPKCLKKVFYDKENLLYIYSVTEWLNVNQINCPKFINTLSGHKYVNYKNSLFILTDWIEGRKCDYNNSEDIFKMADNLGRIHKCTAGFVPISGSKSKNADNTYYTNYIKHFYQLLEFWNRANFYKDTFSDIYMELFDFNYNLSKESIRIINNIDFSVPIGDAVSNHAICHLDYVNKNIIFNKDNLIYTIDFDNARLDYPVHDICYFLRRILKRDETAWDFDLFKKTIESYENIRALSYNEYLVILALLMFPQKYWKLSKDYFKNRTICNPLPFIHAIEKISEKQTEHEVFCNLLKIDIENKFKK
jgi:CotS family spore coat protein